uniref:AAA-ATPase-like domain-containing protein n=1 Tax=Ditylenchus dipsaci TaxID=166011 RepID=A0A915DC06_9BILA
MGFDKTLLIRDFYNSGYNHVLLTLPRCIGKTTALTMIADFFTLNKNQNNRQHFERAPTAIMAEAEFVEKHMGRWRPLCSALASHYLEHEYLYDWLKEGKQITSSTQAEEFHRYCNRKIDESETLHGLQVLISTSTTTITNQLPGQRPVLDFWVTYVLIPVNPVSSANLFLKPSGYNYEEFDSLCDSYKVTPAHRTLAKEFYNVVEMLDHDVVVYRVSPPEQVIVVDYAETGSQTDNLMQSWEAEDNFSAENNCETCQVCVQVSSSPDVDPVVEVLSNSFLVQLI